MRQGAVSLGQRGEGRGGRGLRVALGPLPPGVFASALDLLTSQPSLPVTLTGKVVTLHEGRCHPVPVESSALREQRRGSL